MVAVTSRWAAARVYYPLGYEPYTPQHHFAQGTADPAFRPKLRLAGELVARAGAAGLPFRAVVADRFYGEDAGFRQRRHELRVGDVLALTPSHGWWQQEGPCGTRTDAVAAAGWRDARPAGAWGRVVRTFRDGPTETWWALAVVAGPYGPAPRRRAVVATTAPATRPDHRPWYLATNLPRPGAPPDAALLPAANLAEVVRRYGLRRWVEQGDKRTKYALGWSQ